MRIDDYTRLNCGDTVRERDGRHLARVEAVIWPDVKVKWHDTGWVSWLDRDDLVVVARAEHWGAK